MSLNSSKMATKTKMMEFPTKYSESVQIGTYEVFTKPSMTEPDNALSIPEIIARFTRGYGIPVEQHPWTQGAASEGGEVLDDLQDFFGKPEPAPQPEPEPAPEPAPEPDPEA